MAIFLNLFMLRVNEKADNFKKNVPFSDLPLEATGHFLLRVLGALGQTSKSSDCGQKRGYRCRGIRESKGRCLLLLL